MSPPQPPEHTSPKEGSPGLLPTAILVAKCAPVGHEERRYPPARALSPTCSRRVSTSFFAASTRAGLRGSGAHFANPYDFGGSCTSRVHATLYDPPSSSICSSSGSASRTPPTARQGLERPSPQRLQRLSRTSRAHRAGASTERNRVGGKEAFRGTFRERPELGPQARTIDDVALFVLPSTSPANAAVPYDERLRWFTALRSWLEPVDRLAARALVLDEEGRALLVQFRDDNGQVWWATPGGGIDDGEDVESALRRSLPRSWGSTTPSGPEIWCPRAHLRVAGPHPPPAGANLARRGLSPRAGAARDLAAELVADVSGGPHRARPQPRSTVPTDCPSFSKSCEHTVRRQTVEWCLARGDLFLRPIAASSQRGSSLAGLPDRCCPRCNAFRARDRPVHERVVIRTVAACSVMF